MGRAWALTTQDSDQGLFCDGVILEERRAQLARHFDESWLQIRGKAKELLAAVTREKKQTLGNWHTSLPAVTSLAGDLQAVYTDAVERAREEVDSRLAALEAVEGVLEAKAADPSSTPNRGRLNPV